MKTILKCYKEDELILYIELELGEHQKANTFLHIKFTDIPVEYHLLATLEFLASKGITTCLEYNASINDYEGC